MERLDHAQEIELGLAKPGLATRLDAFVSDRLHLSEKGYRL